ncbi:MAG TPA: hypothetical protein V6D29_10990 [Leptolyngbyaceae cyanobacterium]
MENSTTLLDWIKVLGPIIFSWPLVILFVAIYFRQPLLRILENFSESNINQAKIGPVELGEQKEELPESLHFLVDSFVTTHELDHLEKLNNSDTFEYERNDHFMAELKRLCSLGLIKSSRGLDNLPAHGNLKETLEITERGKQYIEMRNRLVKSES